MNEKCTSWKACIWSNLEMIHWICALNSWFLLRLSLVIVNIFSWNDSINGCKNLCSSDSCNHFYRSSSSNYSACNPRPWCWNRYVVKEEFVWPLKITFKSKICSTTTENHERGPWKSKTKKPLRLCQAQSSNCHISLEKCK